MNKHEDRVEVFEKNVEEERHVFVFVIVTILMAAMVLVVIFGLKIEGTALMIIFIVLIAFYFSAASILLEPKLVKHILKTIIKTEEKIVEIEKPIIREIVKEVEKPVYVHLPRTKLNIPKYDYIASTETKRYHSRNCRLGKLIKKRYKVYNNHRSYFVRRKFLPCKVCIRKIKKV